MACMPQKGNIARSRVSRSFKPHLAPEHLIEEMEGCFISEVKFFRISFSKSICVKHIKFNSLFFLKKGE